MSTPFDPAALAQSLRDLAADIQLIRTSPAVTGDQGQALACRLGRLQDQVAGGPFADLSRWLERARQQIEAC